MSSSVGNSFSSSNLTEWSKQSGMHGAGELMKSPEDGSTLNFNNIPVSTDGSRSDPRLHSSHVASFSPVYILVRRARNWRGVMRFDKKSNSTIINVKSFSAKNWILLSMGK
jgi:hypothetical protein